MNSDPKQRRKMKNLEFRTLEDSYEPYKHIKLDKEIDKKPPAYRNPETRRRKHNELEETIRASRGMKHPREKNFHWHVIKDEETRERERKVLIEMFLDYMGFSDEEWVRKPYVIINAFRPNDLETLVDFVMKEYKFIPLGSPFSNGEYDYFFQAMINTRFMGK